MNNELKSWDIEQIVHEEVLLLLGAQEQPITAIAGETRFHELGLTSLDVVNLAAVLSARLGLDPFTQRFAITDMHTVGALCQVYEQVLSGHGPAAADDLRASQQRAQARRRRWQGSA